MNADEPTAVTQGGSGTVSPRRPANLLGLIGHYLRIVKNHPHPKAFVSSRLLRTVHLSQLVVMRFPRFRLRLYPTSISEAYWIDRGDRREDHAFLERFLRAGDTVVDVGANVGALALDSASLVGRGGRVIAFEPHPRTYRFLRGNISLNRAPNIVTHQVALGPRAGTVEFSDFKSDDENRVAAGTITVPMAPLDTFTDSTPTIELLKLDVEGYELDVLLGAEKTLAKTQCIYFESSEQQYAKYGHRTGDVVALLSAAGFIAHRLLDDGLEPLSPSYESRVCENLVAVRDPARFRRRWNGEDR